MFNLRKKQHKRISRVLVIGDGHDDPHLDKDRFRCAGERIADKQPDLVVLIGDFVTFDSCNQHNKNFTLRGQRKTSIIEDLESAKLAMIALMKPIRELQKKNRRCKEKVYKPKLVITLGNHEDRFKRFIEQNPEMAGMYESMLLSVFIQAGFEVVEYGRYFTYKDMSYTHTPFTGMGKPFGGVAMGRNIALNINFNLTHGHKHEAYELIQPKISNTSIADCVHIICTGSFLPTGFREDYADLSQSYWTSFLTEQTFVDDKYVSTSRVALSELELLYD